MKALKLVISLFFLTIFEGTAQTEFVLEPSQSMIMTGKGSGQDGTINPYFGQDCYAIVRNIGKRQFSIRVQKKGKIIDEITILKGELKKVGCWINYPWISLLNMDLPINTKNRREKFC